VTGKVKVAAEAREGTILWASAPRLKYRPGESVKLYVTYRPFRGPEAIMPVEFELPHDLTDGDYQFTLSGWEQFFADEQTSKPFRFAAESAPEVFAVLREMSKIRHNALYMRLVRQADGVAIGRAAMPNLPSSRREVILGAGRSNTTPFIASATKSIPMDYVLDGAAQLQITIDREERIETAGGKVTRHEPNATPPRAPEGGHPPAPIRPPSAQPSPEPGPSNPSE
jgi:hypothetical protein